VTDVLLATCTRFPHGDEDAEVLDSALLALGVTPTWTAWDDPERDWSVAPAVIRSTWDYTLRRHDYLAWIARVPNLFNPAPVVLWNSDKTYLRDLSAAGVPIVPTSWADPGQEVVLPESEEYVVKPSVGAGSRGVGRFLAGQDDAALRHAASLHEAGRTVMVQPYLAGVDTAGETALIYFDGVFSHAIRKGAMLPQHAVHGVLSDALFVEENISPRTPTPAELAVGAAAVGLLRERFGDLLYTRVDLLPSEDGPRTVELEVTEPSLFLGFADGAPIRFAAAIAARV
jgi:glutathione synthase/RimK-type ligase-like ATP-grasp enzyme